MPRKNTNLILEMVADGLIDKDTLIRACLMWLTDLDVGDMAAKNEFFAPEEDIDESMDGDHDSAMASVGWGTDEDYGGTWEDIEY